MIISVRVTFLLIVLLGWGFGGLTAADKDSTGVRASKDLGLYIGGAYSLGRMDSKPIEVIEIRYNTIKEAYDKMSFAKKKVDGLRVKRNELLLHSDFYFMKDITMTPEKEQKILNYRKDLREFMNKLMDDEYMLIEGNLEYFYDPDFEAKFMPKLDWKEEV